MPSGVDAVLLDVGGLFVLPHPDRIGPALGLHLDEDTAARAHYAGAAAMDALGQEASGAYLTAYALEAGVPASRLRTVLPALATAFDSSTEVWSLIVAESVEALRRLGRTGVALGVVSNSNGTVEQLLRANAICQVGEGPGAAVSVVVDSHVVGVAKPDPAIFDHALEALGVEPGSALHVGDTVHADVAGAAAAGVRPVHLDPCGFCPLDDHEHVASLGEVVTLVNGGASAE
jgi:putative hydrolase of the HAD superfamily